MDFNEQVSLMIVILFVFLIRTKYVVTRGKITVGLAYFVVQYCLVLSFYHLSVQGGSTIFLVYNRDLSNIDVRGKVALPLLPYCMHEDLRRLTENMCQ